MDYELTITADTNDADYTTSINRIDGETLNSVIKPMAEAIKGFQPYKSKGKNSKYDWHHRHNYPHGELYPREDLGEKFPSEIYSQIGDEIREAFEEYLPYGEYGIHTITSISITPWAEKMELLK